MLRYPVVKISFERFFVLVVCRWLHEIALVYNVDEKKIQFIS